MQSRKFLIFGIIIILIITGVCLWSIFNVKENIGLVCHKDRYSLTSYKISYDENNNKIFISTQEEVKKLEGIIAQDEINNLDVNIHDYLIYFLKPQQGCDRIQRLNCIEYDDKTINLNFSTYKIDTTCNITFSDSFIIELPKNKYNASSEVKIINT